MYGEIVGKVSSSGEKKEGLFDKSIFKYLVGAMIAGIFVGIGALTMGLNNMIFKDFDYPIVKIVNGIIFTLALSLVMACGGELFTGNILVFTTRKLEKKISLTKVIKICAMSYIGNFLGALFLTLLFIGSEGLNTPMTESLVALANTKASYPVMNLFFKGVLCNILVCMGVLAYYKMNSESAKLIMLFWCILPFVALGFEHSIANMTIFSIAKIVSSEFTFGLIFGNLIPVTLGNILGGALVALAYFFVGKESK